MATVPPASRLAIGGVATETGLMQESTRTRGVPQDLGAGLFLIAVSLIALWQGADLDAGTLREMGPGMLPRALAILTGLCGVSVATRPLWSSETRENLEAWSLRGALFIMGAALFFAFAIRPLGFTVAGPVAIVLAALGGRETRWVEILAFALAMTAFCTLLFRVALGLPIPVAPWLLDY
jgi:putative tricarboxylic transport membrane protein